MIEQSFYKPNKSYQINSIVASHGRQQAIPRLAITPPYGQSSNTRKLDYSNENLTPPKTQTPSSSLHITEGSSQQTPPMNDMDTPEETGIRKKLFETTEENNQKDDILANSPASLEEKETCDSEEKDHFIHAGTKRNASHPGSTNAQKPSGSNNPRIQKNK